MKLLVVIFVSFTLLLASDTLSIFVKEGSLTVKIGNKSEKLAKGMKKGKIECGKNIKIVDGNGTIEILHGKTKLKSLTNKDSGYTAPKEDCYTVWDKIALLFGVAKDNITKTNTETRKAVSKGAKKEVAKEDIVVKDEKIAICGSKWGALKYRFELYNKKSKKPIYQTTKFAKLLDDNEGKYVYCFAIGKSKLLQGSRYKIVNNVGLDETGVGVKGNIIIKK